ncbi:hypothetical protein CEXT_727981 [Caerostris extrusa]|uniref:Uncharacterized protein n=1 Tax=Caerostris extrusa TaxID=172846 RepID=A0AAV4SXE4_CAEEX|nr:hypothetical protein CEXT_727981 [Caerostris extrusa]
MIPRRSKGSNIGASGCQCQDAATDSDEINLRLGLSSAPFFSAPERVEAETKLYITQNSTHLRIWKTILQRCFAPRLPRVEKVSRRRRGGAPLISPILYRYPAALAAASR